jgi:hypothetical protein
MNKHLTENAFDFIYSRLLQNGLLAVDSDVEMFLHSGHSCAVCGLALKAPFSLEKINLGRCDFKLAGFLKCFMDFITHLKEGISVKGHLGDK